MEYYGYAGKILRVDLTNSKIEEEPLDLDMARRFLGGMGLVSGSRIERLFRSVRLPRIYEGTSEIQRITITRAIIKGEIEE